MTLPRLYSASEAADYLGISPTSFRALKLPRKRFGVRVLYERADLDAWADALPYEGDGGQNTCDHAWGIAS